MRNFKEKLKVIINKYNFWVILVSWLGIIGGLIINPTRIKDTSIFTAEVIGFPEFFNIPISVIEHFLGPFFVGITAFSIIYLVSIKIKNQEVYQFSKWFGLICTAILSGFTELTPIFAGKFQGLYQLFFDVISIALLCFYLYFLDKKV